MTDMKHTSECIHRYELPKSFFFSGGPYGRRVEVTAIAVRLWQDDSVDIEPIGYTLTGTGKRRKDSVDKNVFIYELTSPEQAEYEQAVSTATADARSRCKRLEA